MYGRRIFLLLLGVGICFGAEESAQASRPTRTIARFFGLDSSSPAQQAPQPLPQQIQQPPQQASLTPPRKPVPLIYSVKYYDRTGEGEKHDTTQDHIVQDRVQGVPARVFLNLYTGQQTPVYYDNKGQILVPCPVYDHLYIAGVDQNLVRNPPPSKLIPAPPMVSAQPAATTVPVPPVAPVPEIVYYATPSFVGPNPVQQKQNGGVGLAVVGIPYDFPYFHGIYPYGATGGYNPYYYIKPSVAHHPQITSTGMGPAQQPLVIPQAVEKKEGDKAD